jgi:hypothetical protein
METVLWCLIQIAINLANVVVYYLLCFFFFFTSSPVATAQSACCPAYLHTAYTLRLTFLFFLLAPSSLFAIFSMCMSSTPAGICASSSSKTPWIISRMSFSSSSEKRVPAWFWLSVSTMSRDREAMSREGRRKGNAPPQSPAQA